MSLIYQEKQPTYKLFSVISIIVILLILGILFANYRYQGNSLSWPVQIILLVFLLYNVIILICFFELKIKIFEDKIEFGFGFFKKHFPLHKIKSCQVGNYQFKNYLGFGIKFGKDKTIGYVAQSSQGIKLDIEGQSRKFFITSKNPEKICQIIEDKLKRHRAVE